MVGTVEVDYLKEKLFQSPRLHQHSRVAELQGMCHGLRAASSAVVPCAMWWALQRLTTSRGGHLRVLAYAHTQKLQCCRAGAMGSDQHLPQWCRMRCRSEAAAAAFAPRGPLAGQGKGWELSSATVDDSGICCACGGQLQVSNFFKMKPAR